MRYFASLHTLTRMSYTRKSNEMFMPCRRQQNQKSSKYVSFVGETKITSQMMISNCIYVHVIGIHKGKHTESTGFCQKYQVEFALAARYCTPVLDFCKLFHLCITSPIMWFPSRHMTSN